MRKRALRQAVPDLVKDLSGKSRCTGEYFKRQIESVAFRRQRRVVLRSVGPLDRIQNLAHVDRAYCIQLRRKGFMRGRAAGDLL